MTGLLDIGRVLVPRELADAAQEHLREAGDLGFEGLALWAGRREGDLFLVEQTIIPKQRGLRSEDGVCYHVDADELHRINRHLYEHGHTLIAQLHSHPDEAYHSPVDDEYAIAATNGALSLVVPDFAVRPFDLMECATYRLIPDSGWTRLQSGQVEQLIVMID